MRTSAGRTACVDLFAERFDFAGIGFAFAQFALDGAHLFAQEKIALRLGDVRGDIVLDFGTERQHFLLAVEHRQQVLQAFTDGNGFEQLLAFFERKVQIDGDQIREMAGMLRCSARRS